MALAIWRARSGMDSAAHISAVVSIAPMTTVRKRRVPAILTHEASANDGKNGFMWFRMQQVCWRERFPTRHSGFFR